MGFLESLSKSFGLEKLGIPPIGKLVPSLSKAFEAANKGGDKSFLDRIGIILGALGDEMNNLDKDKKEIGKEADKKVKEIIAEKEKTAPVPSESTPAESSEYVDPDEKFVTGTDHFGGKVILRKGAMREFKKAMKVAEGMGMRLQVVSSYRTFKHQARLHSEEAAKGTENVNKWVAESGHSPHHTGGAIDVCAMKKDGTGKWVGGMHHENQKFLWEIFPKIGFVNYSPEPWHWEIYTDRWRAAHRIAGQAVYKKQESLNV